MGTFHFQRRALTGQPGDPAGLLRPAGARAVGPAGARASTRSTCSARRLQRVLDETVPTGPIVLVGHSMGGMTIMALADEHPELFGPSGRVAGVVLISTSAGELERGHLRLPAGAGPVPPAVAAADQRRPAGSPAGVIDAAREASTDLAWLLTRRYGFGSTRAEPGPGLLRGADELGRPGPSRSLATCGRSTPTTGCWRWRR